MLHHNLDLFAQSKSRKVIWTASVLVLFTFIFVHIHLATTGTSIRSLPTTLFRQAANQPNVTVDSPRFTHPIMIFQHDCQCQGERAAVLAKISQEQHARYAEAHGYVSRVSHGAYVPTDGSYGGLQYFNKIWAVLQVTLEELERPPEERIKWIAQMDADTLMINPAVAIHHTLPPDTLDPEPLVLGEVDFNGFCNGIIFWKVSHRLVTMFTRILTIEYNFIEPDSSTQPQPNFGDRSPADQGLTAIVIKNYRDIQERFYRYPQTFFGSYYPLTQQFRDTRAEDVHEAEDAIRGQMHLAGERKDDWYWEDILHLEKDVYKEAAARARVLGVKGNGLDLMPIVERVKEESRRWWESTPAGIEGVTFQWW